MRFNSGFKGLISRQETANIFRAQLFILLQMESEIYKPKNGVKFSFKNCGSVVR